MVTSVEPGKHFVLKRNPDYFAAAKPKATIETVDIRTVPDTNTQMAELFNGDIDLAWGVPPDQAGKMKSMGKFQVINAPTMRVGYISLDAAGRTDDKNPMTNLKVRQAVNHAINKERIVRILNGRATPASQVLPPLMPGYDKAFPGYEYNVDKAKVLLAEAGLADGFETVLFSTNTDPQPRIAQAIQQDLAAIGVKAEIRALAQGNVIAAGGTEGEAPMIWSGGMAWIADFPDPSNFYGPILGCGGAVQGGWNWAWYCNAELDKRAVAADSMSDPAKSAERIEAWKGIFTDAMKDAPWIPITNERRVVAKSLRMGGENNIYIDPTRVINYAIFVK